MDWLGNSEVLCAATREFGRIIAEVKDTYKDIEGVSTTGLGYIAKTAL